MRLCLLPGQLIFFAKLDEVSKERYVTLKTSFKPAEDFQPAYYHFKIYECDSNGNIKSDDKTAHGFAISSENSKRDIKDYLDSAIEKIKKIREKEEKSTFWSSIMEQYSSSKK